MRAHWLSVCLALAACQGPISSSEDSGTPDVSSPDAGDVDASMPDAGSPDASSVDASTPDASTPEMDAGTPPTGRTLQVGPGRMYARPCQAIQAAQDGDVIEIDAGTYAGDTCAISANNLTLRGVGGRAVLDLTNVTPAEGKAIWVIKGHDTTVEHIEFANAHLSADKNGAGIRQEGANLTVRHCSFHDNDDGILTGANPTSTILIEHSEFRMNSIDAYSHNLYIGDVGQLTFQYNVTSRTNSEGHLLKSRARKNFILYNRITGEDGQDSYEVNLPNGGESYLIGNVIEQGASTQNSAIIDYGSEGFPDGHANTLFVVNNSVVNDRPNGGTFVQVAAATSPAFIANNIFRGPGTVTNQASAVLQANFTNAQGDPRFVNQAGFDYRLQPGSPALGQGVAPGMSPTGVSLTPVQQYVHPASGEARPTKTPLDIGAYAGP